LQPNASKEQLGNLETVTCEENFFFFVGSEISEIVFYRKFTGTAGKRHNKANECLWLVN
jgi:hypothetical protein